jgi:hypothetical protein
MSNTKRAIQIASGTYNEPMKPEPPEDLWEQLDAAVNALENKRPINSFTRAEFQERRGGISASAATRLLGILQKSGKIRKEGMGNSFYYVLVEDK